MSKSAPIFALAAALLFGASTPLAKIFLHDSSPMMLAGLLYGGSGVGLAMLCVFRAKRSVQSLRNFQRAERLPLAGAILFGGVIGPGLIMFGLQRLSGSTVSLLLNLESAFTALIACLVFQEQYGKRLVLGLVLILSGGAVLSGSDQKIVGEWGGILAVMGACACWAIDNNLAKKVASLDPSVFAGGKGLVAGAANVFLAIQLGQSFPSPGASIAIMAIGFAGYGLSLVLFILSLRKLGAARTSAYFSTAPFVGGLLSILVLKEPVTWALAVAGLFMAAGVYLHLTERHVRKGRGVDKPESN